MYFRYNIIGLANSYLLKFLSIYDLYFIMSMSIYTNEDKKLKKQIKEDRKGRKFHSFGWVVYIIGLFKIFSYPLFSIVGSVLNINIYGHGSKELAIYNTFLGVVFVVLGKMTLEGSNKNTRKILLFLFGISFISVILIEGIGSISNIVWLFSIGALIDYNKHVQKNDISQESSVSIFKWVFIGVGSYFLGSILFPL